MTVMDDRSAAEDNLMVTVVPVFSPEWVERRARRLARKSP